ncbi:MAG: hypothetical protein LH475_01715 [Cryobacterium sp.]|uniref:hypothetical protein n=1 Tax=Cryobacterium sp. TaxID=1926290 RepID=UPI0022898DCC|nr:hypothetical protein [Cryobacterium sp.]MCY7403347.1 hypothetical protein [Cryobacterium sp.]
MHARTIVGCAIDGRTGEIIHRKFSADLVEVLGWVRSLPGPQTVAYEAGPTGFGLARLFVGAGIDCLVAAPSKLQRPTGDRVKTDARDAFQLARLLHVGDITVVACPHGRGRSRTGLGAVKGRYPAGFDECAASDVEAVAAARFRVFRRCRLDGQTRPMVTVPPNGGPRV